MARKSIEHTRAKVNNPIAAAITVTTTTVVSYKYQRRSTIDQICNDDEIRFRVVVLIASNRCIIDFITSVVPPIPTCYPSVSIVESAGSEKDSDCDDPCHSKNSSKLIVIRACLATPEPAAVT